MGMSDEARALRDIAKSLQRIAAELSDMNDQLDEKARRRVMIQLGGLDIPEDCPEERRWTDPVAVATCGTCRRYWACPYPSPGQDPKGGK